MGTEVISTVVKALSGTWPPLTNTPEEAGELPKALVDAAPDAVPAVAEEAEPGVALTGPREMPLLLEPPATTPAAPAATRPSLSTPARSTPTKPGAGRRHTVTRGDTLFSLAQKYYGSRSRWHEIYDANRDVLPKPDALRLGMELKIP